MSCCVVRAGLYRCRPPVAIAAGVGVAVAAGMAGLELGALYPFDEERGTAQLAAAVGFCEEWSGAGDGRVSCMLGPQGTDMLPEGLLKRCWAEAEAHGWMIHLHLAQGDREINQMIKRCAPPACLQLPACLCTCSCRADERPLLPGVSFCLPVCRAGSCRCFWIIYSTTRYATQ